MLVSNWKFHNKKYNKRTLKPQAMRQSRAKLRSLINKIHDSQSVFQGRGGKKGC